MKEAKVSKAYSAAIEVHNAAIVEFEITRDAYRARTVGDAEFLAARQKFDAATAGFDLAFNAEAARGQVAA